MPTDLEFTAEELARLPKWAQTKIANLHQRVREAAVEREAQARRLADPRSTPVRILGYDMGDIGLPPDRTIRFDLGVDPMSYIEVRLIDDEHLDGRRTLQVNSGRNGILVRPRSGNSVEVTADAD